MDYREKYKFLKTITMITLFCFTLTLILISVKLRTPQKVILNIQKEVIPNDSFSPENLYKLILMLDIKNPDIVFKQAKLETGNFTSDRFKKYNALFGFQTSDIQIVKYNSWKESVIHYKTWQMFRLKENEDYYDFLIRVKYASDSNYVKKLKQFKDA